MQLGRYAEWVPEGSTLKHRFARSEVLGAVRLKLKDLVPARNCVPRPCSSKPNGVNNSDK